MDYYMTWCSASIMSIFRITFIPTKLWTPNAHNVSLMGVHNLVGISAKYIYSHKAMDTQCPQGISCGCP